MQLVINLPQDLDSALELLQSMKSPAPVEQPAKAKKAPKPTEQLLELAKPVESAPAPEESAPAPEEQTSITQEIVKQKAVDAIKNGNRTKVLDALKELGTTTVSGLKPEQFADFLNRING